MLGILLSIFLSLILSSVLVAPWAARLAGRFAGLYLRRRSSDRRTALVAQVRLEDQQHTRTSKVLQRIEDEDWERVESSRPAASSESRETGDSWEGIVGFFHPFCNAGGGGERVLWAAIRATQKRWPKAICVVYTGDHDVQKATILSRVEERFGIHIHAPTVVFIYLSTRHYVLSSTYPHFTLLGQSLGSLVLAYDAFSLLVPDIFIDTMGYAFTLALSKYFFPDVPAGAYVHYPTISTDMLGSLDEGGQGVNAGTGTGLKGYLKRKYWHLFANMYSWVGGNVDVVMTNSSWTQAHIRALWDGSRKKRGKTSEVGVVFPPVAVEEMEREIEVTPATEDVREKVLLYIAQFRPEKNHTLILRAFSEFLRSEKTKKNAELSKTKLVLIGSVRHSDDATRVYELRLLARELDIKDHVEFICDASWPEVIDWLRRSSVGVNGMWNEHFGIGVVEYQAAGLISVVNNSGGPKHDIVVPYEGKPTGFHATTPSEFASGFHEALSLSRDDTIAMRLRARASAKRFSEDEFASRWLYHVEQLVALQTKLKS
ncbi:glycosyltransferase family 4 protein [Xylona heveae TC161]|uniref:GDP-Man:Man(3)GlcNAc(2)-PP-Dol alpha-1,2-mannosyltransferase n=1 Tax=Xylona heveae (strain CBS 132557 / TC161) TaxID=1328760 RepID=A0A165J6E9_XYLHT|nr:glycosyltransferase family 4 protein [Xylona heveae TC161]KZF25796.1 glycosyltransferase family 4 protein [Xylona heveae TC161]